MSTPAAPTSPSAAPDPSPPPAAQPGLAPSAPKRLQLPLYFWAAMALGLLLVYNLIFSPSFYRLETADGHLIGHTVNVFYYGSKVMLIALGMTLVIATGGIDLSVGAIMAITGGVTALLMGHTNVLTGQPQVPSPIWVAVAAGLGASILAGLWNGALIGYVNIQPIIATLILMISGRGLAIYLTNGQVPTIADSSPFLYLARGSFLGIPLAIVMVLVVSAFTIALVRGTALGMFFESIGNSSPTCQVAGINTRFFKLMAYGFVGFCSGMAGIVDAAMNRVGDANQSGLDIELDAIVAVAIGGTSLVGGRFSLIGSLLGALAMQTLTETIQSSSLNPQYNFVIKAFVVILICLLQSPKIRALIAKARKTA